MLIYLCLSSHGFGHASRQAHVFYELHKLQPSWRLVVSSSVEINFLRVAFSGLPVEFRQMQWDVGVKQPDALGVDLSLTLSSLQKLHQNLPAQISSEANWIMEQRCPGIVIGDIPPAAADLATNSGFPLIWIGNFGWDEIYQPFGFKFKRYYENALYKYSLGNLLIRCPFSLSMKWGLKEREIGLTVSNLRKLPEYFLQKIRNIGNPIVLIGFGGLGINIPINILKTWKNYHFLIPISQGIVSQLEKSSNNITFLPENIRILDVLPYCKLHIGKPGYSSFCECLSQHIGMHVVTRRNFAEAEALIRGLKKHGFNRLLEKEQFLAGQWELDKPLNKPTHSAISSDGAKKAAIKIVEFLT